MPLPDATLRSVLRFTPADAEDALQDNLQALLREWPDTAPLGVDGTIVAFTADLYSKSPTIPTYALVHGHFRTLGDHGDGVAMAAATRLELLQSAGPAFVGAADFRYTLDQFRDDLLAKGLTQAVLQTTTILSAGLDQTIVKQGQRVVTRLQGPQAALTYLNHELNQLIAKSGGAPAEGSLATDAAAAWRLYETRRDNPLKTGILSGLTDIDSVHHGIRPGELALVLGFVGHMKSTLVNAWAYHGAVYQKRNAAVVSCEIPLDDLRAMYYVMHGAHTKFSSHPAYMTLSVTGVQHGTLTPLQEELFRAVMADFETSTDYGRIYYREPSSVITMADIQRWAEGLHRRTPIDLLVIDYLGLVDPGKVGLHENTGSRLNAVVRQAKLLAMSFGAGRGVSLLSPFQANREGWKDAEKNGGRYKLTALSWANEAERSADLIYYVWLDDLLRGSRELAMGNLKSRLVPLITDQFRIFADPVSRVIANLDLTNPVQAPVDIS